MESIQQALTVFAVLAVLAGTLFWLRSKGVAQFNVRAFRGGGQRRLQAIERLPLTPQHSLHLIRIGGRELLLAVSPGGCSILESSQWRRADQAGAENL